MTLRLILLIWSCLAAAGCGYFKDRVKDASEMFEAAVGFSPGLSANFRATKFLQVGFGGSSGYWVGLEEGRFAAWWEERAEMGLLFFYYHDLHRTGGPLVPIRHPLPGESGYGEYMNDLFLITDRGFFEVGLSASVLAPGIDAAFDLAEIADFVTGWAGLDLLSDDAYSRSLEELACQAQSRSARLRLAAIRGLRLRTGKEFGYRVVTPADEHPEEQIAAWRRWNAWIEEQPGHSAMDESVD